MPSRRTFLGQSLAATFGLAAAGALSPARSLVHAAETNQSEGIPDRFYIFCYFPGGWDILLSLDPRDPAIFNNQTMKISQIQPGYDLLDIPGDTLYEPVTGMKLGPFIGDLKKHAERMAVIRGMSMETLSHDAGRRRFLTGKTPAGSLARGSSSDVWLSSQLGSEAPIPNLAMRVESYNRGLPNYASALKTAQHADLTRVLRAAEPDFGALHDQQIAHLLESFALCPEAAPSQFWHEAAEAVTKKNQMVQQDLAGFFDFQEK